MRIGYYFWMQRNPTKSREGKAVKSAWGWSAAAKRCFSGQDSRVGDVVAILPTQKKSSDEEIATYLIDLGARFQRWLHQDEFGPSRRQQTASLRALVRSSRNLQRELTKSSSLLKDIIDATLRRNADSLAPVLEAFCEAISQLERTLECSGAQKQKVARIAKLEVSAQTLMAQLQSLDTNTDSKIFVAAFVLGFNLSQTATPDLGLADVERWLIGYSSVVLNALNELNRRRGAEERVSLKLLVEELCTLWEYETGDL
jgi:hypothetical protein